MNLSAYLICMGVSAVLTALFTALLLKRNGVAGNRAYPAGALLLVLGVVLGFVGAKLLYFLLEMPIILMRGVLPFLRETQLDELSYYGGVAGVTLAAFLTSKLLKLNTRHFLNTFAPAGAFMAAMSRFAEYYLGMLCVGDYLEESFFPLAVTNNWGEYYLAVFFLEAAFSLVMVVFALLRQKDRNCFVRTLFYLCAAQIFFESLRNQSISWLFVRAEQLLCFLYCEGVLIAWGVRASRLGNRRGWLPWVIGIVVALLTVAEEFALDKTDIPHLITYICMVAGLVVLGATEVLTYRWIRAQDSEGKLTLIQ